MAHPHPHTWTTDHLRDLEAAALAIGKEPLGPPTDDEARAFAASLPARFKHIEAATYNPRMRRIEVQLHKGADGVGVAFPVSVRVDA